MEYNANNVFAKIIRKEIPADIVYEDDYTMAFRDIKPKAPIHILVIPKGMYTDYSDFMDHASPAEITAFMRTIAKVAADLNLLKSGYRVVLNAGPNSGQEVPHIHAHILGGKKLSLGLG